MSDMETRERLIDILCKFSVSHKWILSVGSLADFLMEHGVILQEGDTKNEQ